MKLLVPQCPGSSNEFLAHHVLPMVSELGSTPPLSALTLERRLARPASLHLVINLVSSWLGWSGAMADPSSRNVGGPH